MSYLLNVLSGAERGVAPAALRAATGVVEPFYATVMRVRNRMFDSGMLSSHDLGRPTISVGNITAGGTGKTPLVRWLAERLRERDRHVAVLARGYKSSSTAGGDEQIMLERALNMSPASGAPSEGQDEGSSRHVGEDPHPNPLPEYRERGKDGSASMLPHRYSRVELVADPDRVGAAAGVLRGDPSIDVFILDDGFQHRRARRHLDLVLLSAPEPFGFGHVLPRGLLREPLAGLRRADACIVTHADQVSAQDLTDIEQQVRQHHASVPIYRSVHRHVALWNRNAGVADQRKPVEMLGQTPFFAFAGIGSPDRFDRQLARWGSAYRGHRWFADHHPYSVRDLNEVREAGRRAGAQVLVTTEKDWVKLMDLPRGDGPPIWRLEMAIEFLGDDEARLSAQVMKVVELG